MSESEATALVAALAASFPKQPIGEPTVKAYAGSLLDLDVQIATAAVRTLQQGSTFFPSIHEIRTMVADLELGAPPPMQAWESARQKGAPRHPVVQRARRIVGDDFHWRETPSGILQKSFLAAYAEAKDEAMRAIVTPGLAAAQHDAIERAHLLELEETTSEDS
jgi:hypothetical protein